MIRFTREAVRRWLDALLHIADTPRRTAAAYALGVFFGFSPLLGLHTVLALACAFVLSLNRVAVLLGVYSNLPWIIGPWYAGTTALGGADPAPSRLRWLLIAGVCLGNRRTLAISRVRQTVGSPQPIRSEQLVEESPP